MSEPDDYDVKFRLTGWDKKTYLSINLIILKVPAEPAVWQLQLAERAATQDTADVRCGEPFQLLVEAHDKFGNRRGPLHGGMIATCANAEPPSASTIRGL